MLPEPANPQLKVDRGSAVEQVTSESSGVKAFQNVGYGLVGCQGMLSTAISRRKSSMTDSTTADCSPWLWRLYILQQQKLGTFKLMSAPADCACTAPPSSLPLHCVQMLAPSAAPPDAADVGPHQTFVVLQRMSMRQCSIPELLCCSPLCSQGV